MKLSDVQINTEYACGSPRENTDRLRDRVRVIEIGPFQKSGWASTSRRKRAKVVLLDKETGATLTKENGDPWTKVVDGQELLRSWTEEVDRHTASVEAQKRSADLARSRQQAFDASYEEVFERCKELGLARDVTYDWASLDRKFKDFQFQKGMSISSSGAHKVVMPVGTFRELLVALEGAGIDAVALFGKGE